MFTDSKEDIEFEIKQMDLALQRKQAQNDREKKGWFYKAVSKSEETD